MRTSTPLFAALVLLIHTGQPAAATLEGFARLPADTLMPGPDSGHFIEVEDGPELPFKGQPVQGFSAIISNDDSSYLVLSDNGYGSRENSTDFLLRVYCITPDFRTATGGSGHIHIDGFINLSDPERHYPYRLIADANSDTKNERLLPIISATSTDRLLTGSDLDPESLQRAPDGSFWVGDEFGPFILHLNAQGELIDPPFSLAGLVSESHPLLSHQGPLTPPEPTLSRSRGFEGMAITPSGARLYPMLEGSLKGQARQLNIYSFDLESKTWENASALDPSFRYRLEPEATAIGAFKLFSETQGLVLELDSGEGSEARHKKIYRVDFNQLDDHGFLLKRQVADLMDIADPHDLNGDGSNRFEFPFITPEGLLVMDSNTIGLINDNNYPFGRGRGAPQGPEQSEFILITVADLW
jgi:hypothetical protein